MSTSRRKFVLNTVSVNLGCSSCKRPKISHFFHPKPKPKLTSQTPQLPNHSSSTSSIWDKDDAATTTTITTSNTAATLSPYGDNYATVRGLGRVGGEGVAVEKDSEDPYLDFRHSMIQMIMENEIYSKDELRELLSCFLELNSPYHHGVIVRAFTEIWNALLSLSLKSNSPSSHIYCNACIEYKYNKAPGLLLYMF
ncbi:transcription repressor OFP6-like [Senna tora]|uniref:Transcription repressor n=1 Tax=Senna tora TaxID=362788 RepID=A0A834TD43_9FABA|nr:transcription repressor OFP6-like [Senna tora]